MLALVGIQVLCPLWLFSNTFFDNPWCVEESELSPKGFCEIEILTQRVYIPREQEQCMSKEDCQAEFTQNQTKILIQDPFLFLSLKEIELSTKC